MVLGVLTVPRVLTVLCARGAGGAARLGAGSGADGA